MECVRVEDDRPLHEMRFDAAVKVIQSLPPDGSFQPSNDMMLRFYSYYKQATLGPCNIPRPGFWDPVGKAKWDAWDSLEQMTREEAMTAYVEEMKLILEGMPITDEVEALLKILGPFYELVDEKRKISQVSDLTPGFGNMMSSTPSKSITKSIIRTMEMNGTLESRPAKPAPPNNNMDIKQNGEEAQEDEDDDDDDDDDEEEEEEEEEEEVKEVKKVKKGAASQPKKKASARKAKAPVSNGRVGNGVAHLANGGHSSKSALNGDASGLGVVTTAPSPGLQLNGHHRDSSEEGSGPHHLASDSDSEVYCDSMDQIGLEEGSEERLNSHSSLGLDEEEEEESHSPLSSQEDPQAPQGPAAEAPGPPEAVQCGGEDGETGGGASERRRLSADRPGGSLVRRGRGSGAQRSGPGEQGPVQGSAGDGEGWGPPGAAGGRSLDQQIVVALDRLQEDMQSVLQRLHSLEALSASQARSLALPPNYTSTPAKKSTKKPSWWPFEVSPSTVAFAVIWPFVVQWLIRLYLQRRRRRIN